MLFESSGHDKDVDESDYTVRVEISTLVSHSLGTSQMAKLCIKV